MNIIDIVTILGNVSRSLYPVQRLITGLAYMLGILFFMTAIAKLRKIGDKRTQSSSNEKMYTPLMHILIGTILVYLPTGLHVVANTAFGVGNVLSYGGYNPANVYSSVGLLVRTAGLLWFIRGCVLLVHASEPGTQQGGKGLAFLAAGVLAMNFNNTVAMLNSLLQALLSIKFR